MTDTEMPTMTPEQIAYVEQYGGSIPKEKETIHTFLHNIVLAPDTTKLGNLSQDELGLPKLPLRTHKELQLFCDKIADLPDWADWFGRMAENLTATSLSKEAKLIEAAVMSKKEIGVVDKRPRKENSGWFKPKNKPEVVA